MAAERPAPRIVGVIPAAGYAERLQPLPCSKEVYPIGGRPVMDYLVERMSAVPRTEIRIVTRPEKTDVAEHARGLGLDVVLAYPRNVAESILAGIEGLPPETVVLFGFPDTIWEPVDGYRPVAEAVLRGYEVALGLFETADLERSDVVAVDARGMVKAIEVKPSRPSSTWIWGCGAARALALARLSGEQEVGVYLDRLCGAQDVPGIRLSRSFLDVGTPEALRRASRR